MCKRTGIGLNLHHIDGDSSNTVEENLAVLCINEHEKLNILIIKGLKVQK